jgi:hypothetical protein
MNTLLDNWIPLLILTALITTPIFIIVREPVLWLLHFTHPDAVFHVRLSMAKRGYYKYDGLMGMAKYSGLPMAQVKYPDGKLSVPMAMGDAASYMDMFGGTVCPMKTQ